MKQGQKTNKKTVARKVRHARIRAKISGTSSRPRLVVFRSNVRIEAQIIDDKNGKTLVTVSDNRVQAEKGDRTGKIAQAFAAGKELAEKAKALNITAVLFDRGGNTYHGRVKALAEGAREGGLEF